MWRWCDRELPEVSGWAPDLGIRRAEWPWMRWCSIMCSSGWVTGDVLDDVAALVAERNRLDARLAGGCGPRSWPRRRSATG